MKFRLFAAALALLVAAYSAAPAHAQQAQLTPAEIAKIKTDLVAAAQVYMQTFTAHDTKGIVEKVWANPGLASDAKGITIMTPDKVANMYDSQYRDLEKLQYDHSVMTKEPVVCVLSANNAIMNLSFQRIKKDGSRLLEATAAYWYKKTADGWRMATILDVGIKNPVTCD